MKKKTLFFGIFLLAIIFPIITFAATSDEEFTSLTMDIVIDDDATASITEVWNVTITSGTEMYKAYSNMETSVVQNLSVTDETGTKYTTLSSWDTSATDKTSKCGILTTSDGYELCWGIGDYGTHTYTISYEITNFVSYYEDDGIQKTYFTLVDSGMDPLPQSVEITVAASGFKFTDDNVSVAGYGFTGTTQVDDGVAKLKTSSALASSGYVDLYIEYQDEPFNTTDTVSSSSSSGAYEEDSSTLYSYSGSTSGSVSTSSSSTSSSKIGWYILIIVAIVIVVIFIRKGRKDQAEYYNGSDDDNNNNPIQ